MTQPAPPVGSMAAAQANSKASGAASAPSAQALQQAIANASGSGTPTQTGAAVDQATLARYQNLNPQQKSQVWSYFIALHPGTTQMPATAQGLGAPPLGMATSELTEGINLVMPFSAQDPAATPATGPNGPDEFSGLDAETNQGTAATHQTSHQADQGDVQKAMQTDAKSTPYMQAIVFYAGQLNIPWQMLWGVIEATSGFDPTYTNGTVHGIAGLPNTLDGADKDPNQSIQLAASNLAAAYDKYKDWGLAVMAYNQGDAAAQYMQQNGKPANGTDTQALGFWAKVTAPLAQMGLDMTGTQYTTTKAVLSAGPDKVTLPDQATLKQTVTTQFQQMFFRQPSPTEVQAFMDIVNQVTTAGQTGQNNPYAQGATGGPGGSSTGQTPQTPGGVIGYAKTLIGTPYLWGGTGTAAEHGQFDCSGMVQHVLQQFGVDPGRNTTAQIANRNGAPVENLGAALPGDILFFGGTATNPEHEGIYIGNGQMIDSPHTGSTIGIHNIAGYGAIVGIRRFSVPVGSDGPVPAGQSTAGVRSGAQVTTQPEDQATALTNALQGTKAYQTLYGQKPVSETDAQFAAQFQTDGKVGALDPSDQAISLGMQANDPNLTKTIATEAALTANDPSAIGSLSSTALALKNLI